MPAQPTNETALVKAIVTAVLRKHPDAYWLKVHGGPSQRVGVPDLLLCVEGRWIGLEAKHRKPGESEEHARGRATPRQLSELRKIEAAGGLGAVVLSAEEALAVIEAGLRGD